MLERDPFRYRGVVVRGNFNVRKSDMPVRYNRSLVEYFPFQHRGRTVRWISKQESRISLKGGREARSLLILGTEPKI
jgi:hypothetical protein